MFQKIRDFQDEPQLVVWAVDPFIQETAYLRAAARAIHEISRTVSLIVQPVYLLSSEFPTIRMLLEDPGQLLQDLRAQGQARLAEALRPRRSGEGPLIPGLLPLRLLPEDLGRRRSGVDEVHAYAEGQHARLIVASTHARRGLARIFLGSFVESLMLGARTPLLVVNPECEPTGTYQNIVFATDFSDESFKAFLGALRLAQDLGSELLLFHKLGFIPVPSPSFAYSAYPLYNEVFERESLTRRQDAQNWAEIGQKAGVNVQVWIDEDLVASVADSILAVADRYPGLIAMASHSGRVQSVLLGSTTRKVVRASRCPVWVIHPERNRLTGIGHQPLDSLYSITEREVIDQLNARGRRTRAG